jgi:hypothetical protein
LERSWNEANSGKKFRKTQLNKKKILGLWYMPVIAVMQEMEVVGSWSIMFKPKKMRSYLKNN